jgi:16S rRNA processing protein RimM
MDGDRVVIAEILRERGNRGEVLVRSQTDVCGRMQELSKACIQLADGRDLVLDIQSAWAYKGDWVFKFAGIDSIDSARELRGADIWVPREQRGQLDEGKYFRSDLVGCEVIDRQTGSALGVVAGWQEHGGPLLLEVDGGNRELLIPFVDAICSVDMAARLITVDAPEGLLSL